MKYNFFNLDKFAGKITMNGFNAGNNDALLIINISLVMYVVYGTDLNS